MSLAISRRSPKRSRVFLHASLDTDGQQEDVLIRDVSTVGCLVEADDSPATDAIVRLHCGDTSVEGRVAWTDGGRFGVEFAGPLTSGFLVDTMGRKLKVSAPRAYDHNRLPEEDEQAEVSARVIRLRNTIR